MKINILKQKNSLLFGKSFNFDFIIFNNSGFLGLRPVNTGRLVGKLKDNKPAHGFLFEKFNKDSRKNDYIDDESSIRERIHETGQTMTFYFSKQSGHLNLLKCPSKKDT